MPWLFILGLVLLPIAVGDCAAQQLVADVKQSIHNASRSLQGVAIDLDVPLSKLSDQLNGKLPFTYCWRVLAAFPDVRMEFLDIQAERLNATLVRPGELSDLVGGVRALVGIPKRMAKASLPDVGQKAQAV